MSKYFKYIISIYYVLISFGIVNASRIDSLARAFSLTEEDTQKVIIYNLIAKEFINKYPEKALDKAHKASILAREASYHHGLIESLIISGTVYKNGNNNQQAIKFFEKAKEAGDILSDHSLGNIIHLNLAELYFNLKQYNQANFFIDKVNSEKFNHKLWIRAQSADAKIKQKVGKFDEAILSYFGILKSYNNNSLEAASTHISLGEINQLKANYTESQFHFYKALKIYELEDYKEGIASVFVNLGNLNFEQRLFDNALDFNFKALAIYNEHDDNLNKSKVYDNIGLVYHRTKNYPRALEYFTQSLNIRIQSKNEVLESRSYNLIADLYEDQKDLSKAIIYHFKSIKLLKDLEDMEALAEAYLSLSRLYFHSEQYPKVIETASKGYKAAEYSGNSWLIQEIAKLLAESNQKKGNYKEGYLYYETYSNIKDSLRALQKSQQIERLETIYENERKEKEIALLNKEKELQELAIKKQEIQRNGLIIALLLLLIVFFFMYRAFKQKEATENLIRKQNALVEKKNQDIMASLNYAKRIQDSILCDTSKLNDLVKDAFVMFMPKEIVSGDFYWFEKIESKAIFAVIDCTGHGVPGAFMSMVAGELLNDIIKTNRITDPGEILKSLHERVITGLNKKETESFTIDGLNIAICSIEDNQNKLYFSSSGRPLIHISEDNIEEITGSKFPIGMVTRKERIFETKVIDFKSDDLFYIFTDGITDQFNGVNNEKLTRDGLIDQLNSIKANSLKVQHQLLIDFFNKWKSNSPQIDDVCMIGVRV